jgi:hypothetical protein
MVAVDLDAALDEALGEAWTNVAQQALSQSPRRVIRKKVVGHRNIKRRSSSLPPPRTNTASSKYKKRGISSRSAATTVATPSSPPLSTIEEGDAETATLHSMGSRSRRNSLNDSHSCGGGSWNSGGADSCFLRREARFGTQYYDPEEIHFLDEVADRRLVDLLALATTTAVDLDSSESSTSETDCNSDGDDGTIVVEQSSKSPPSQPQQPQPTSQSTSNNDHAKRARSAFQRRHRAQLCMALATLLVLGGAIGTKHSKVLLGSFGTLITGI